MWECSADFCVFFNRFSVSWKKTTAIRSITTILYNIESWIGHTCPEKDVHFISSFFLSLFFQFPCWHGTFNTCSRNPENWRASDVVYLTVSVWLVLWSLPSIFFGKLIGCVQVVCAQVNQWWLLPPTYSGKWNNLICMLWHFVFPVVMTPGS